MIARVAKADSNATNVVLILLKNDWEKFISIHLKLGVMLRCAYKTEVTESRLEETRPISQQKFAVRGISCNI